MIASEMRLRSAVFDGGCSGFISGKCANALSSAQYADEKLRFAEAAKMGRLALAEA
jgi:hypothetical protein